MACQVMPEIMTELLALKKKILDDVCHLRGSCQVYHERELIVPFECASMINSDVSVSE